LLEQGIGSPDIVVSRALDGFRLSGPDLFGCTGVKENVESSFRLPLQACMQKTVVGVSAGLCGSLWNAGRR
jgi:hypothetical protein